ncbi:helix-turn-helix domain-containing protein [Marinicella sp. W31]|uniref:helix-turn-helix domain-containing protein n=1 Tax=Marinicella sp. W31 TaxID=3023713 RepID=UPI0037583F65
MSFSTRLRELRLHFGLTQKQLAQLVGVTKGSISQWEVGLVNPRNIKAENMEKLCKVLQKPVAYLLDGKQSSASVKDNTASYDAGYDAFLNDCIIYTLDNGENLSNTDKALAIRLLYNKSRHTEVISDKIFKDILKML